jgi:hypothetical protein
MDSSSSIILGVLFGSIGLGYIVYGRKQKKGIALFSGIALCAYNRIGYYQAAIV